MLAFIAGFFMGTTFGVVTMCLMIAASDTDKWSEDYWEDKKKNDRNDN